MSSLSSVARNRSLSSKFRRNLSRVNLSISTSLRSVQSSGSAIVAANLITSDPVGALEILRRSTGSLVLAAASA
jgi:hypothetical protein